jgi:uncharacterized protein
MPRLSARVVQQRRSLLRAPLALGAAALGGCAWIGQRERLAIYRPERGVTMLDSQPCEQRWLQAVPAEEGGTEQLAFWWLPHPDPRAPSLLYLHGTFRNLYRNRPKIEAIARAGFSVLAVDYRGWGESSERIPSEATIYADAWSAWGELCRREPVAGRRALFGHSLGGAVAVELASQLPRPQAAGSLILESTFTCLPDVARTASAWGTPLSWLMTQTFDSIAKITRVNCPVLVMHGSADATVPIALGRRLYEAARDPRRFVEFERGSHSDLHAEQPERYRAAVGEEAARLAALAPWRPIEAAARVCPASG